MQIDQTQTYEILVPNEIPATVTQDTKGCLPY